jgi:aryl-alcohol dehydrogenase-like predicted oxidoreductase
MESPPLSRAIPSTGEMISIIGLGTWKTFDVGRGAAERAPLEDCLRSFTALGGGLVDSSPMYGRSEEVIGDLIAKLGVRERVFVATKVWTSGRLRGLNQMKASMRKLHVEPVDLIQVHNLVDVHTHLETLREWKAEERVRYIGVTHYTATHHGEVARVLESESVDFVQINYSVAERDAEQRILPLAAERGIAVIVNRPFGAGDLLGRVRGKPVPDWATAIECDTWAQLLLKFVVSHPAVTCAIPATSSADHLRDNMRAGSGPMPDDAMREDIARAFRAAR